MSNVSATGSNPASPWIMASEEVFPQVLSSRGVPVTHEHKNSHFPREDAFHAKYGHFSRSGRSLNNSAVSSDNQASYVYRNEDELVHSSGSPRALAPSGHPSWAVNPAPLESDKRLHDRIMNGYLEAKRTVEEARAQLNLPWSDDTKKKMKSLFGTDDQKVLAPELDRHFSEIKEDIDSIINSNGEKLYLHDKKGFVATLDLAQGKMGGIYFSRDEVPAASDHGLVETLIHESSHRASGTRDKWYISPGKDNDFPRRAPLGKDGRRSDLPPLTTATAFRNADTISNSAQVLDKNPSPRRLVPPAPFKTTASDVAKGPDAGWRNYIQDLGPRGIVVYQPLWRTDGRGKAIRPQTDPPEVSGYKLRPNETQKNNDHIVYYYSKV